MTQYIDKSAVVAEIERRRKLVSDPILSGDDLMIGERNALFNLLSFINTLEVKEVDLEKEIKSYFDSQPIITRSKGIDYQLIPTGVDIAKYFFELGLKAQKGE